MPSPLIWGQNPLSCLQLSVGRAEALRRNPTEYWSHFASHLQARRWGGTILSLGKGPVLPVMAVWPQLAMLISEPLIVKGGVPLSGGGKVPCRGRDGEPSVSSWLPG